AKAIRLGHGLEKDTTMGPMANARRIDAMDTFVADAKNRGGKIQTGGSRHGNQGFFFEPTVVTDVPDDAKAMTEGPFGPIAPIVTFKSFDEVVERANSLPYGLAAYAFTSSNSTAAAIGDAMQSGMVGVNSIAISTPETPFGGVKESGHGSEGGTEGLGAYLNTKFISQPWPSTPAESASRLPGPPASSAAVTMPRISASVNGLAMTSWISASRP